MSEDEDIDCYPPQALPIGTHTAGEKPQDGLQYLSIVHSEASHIPDVMSVDRSMFDLAPDVSTPRNQSGKLNFPSGLINKQVHKFSKLRQYCSRMQKLHPSKLQGDEVELSFSKKTFDKEPCLSLVLSLSQISLFEVLDYVQDVCLSAEEKSRVPTCVSSWVFSLLCVADKPVPMDYMAIIRYKSCLNYLTIFLTVLQRDQFNYLQSTDDSRRVLLILHVCNICGPS